MSRTAGLAQNTTKRAALAIAAVSAFAVFGLATGGASALVGGVGTDKLDVGSTVNNTNDDGSSQSVGLRLLSTDQLENLGLGVMANNKDADGNEQSLDSKVELTDNLQDAAADLGLTNKTEDSKQTVDAGVKTDDLVDKVGGNVDVSNETEDNKTNAGIEFSFE